MHDHRQQTLRITSTTTLVLLRVPVQHNLTPKLQQLCTTCTITDNRHYSTRVVLASTSTGTILEQEHSITYHNFIAITTNVAELKPYVVSKN